MQNDGFALLFKARRRVQNQGLWGKVSEFWNLKILEFLEFRDFEVPPPPASREEVKWVQR